MSELRCMLPLILIAAIGCGGGRAKLPTASVAGVVMYHGKPLGMGRIIFFHPSGYAAGADLAVDGTFNLIAYQGNNHVAVECFDADRPGSKTIRSHMMTDKSLVPERYMNYSTSGLTFEVKPGKNNEAEFSLED